jgi:cytochrome c biogenesis protein CcmG/thiol:disulfide interchange protein DsbE
MMRWFTVLFLFGNYAIAQSRVELLKNVEHRYASANSFEVKGRASALLPGTSWRVSYEFDTQAMQPTFIPLNVRSVAMQGVSRVGGNFTKVRTDPHATDPFPEKGIILDGFGGYERITHRMLDAIKVGSETITLDGHAHECEIVDATYDTSPEFRPHSQIAHRRWWIDSKDLTVLRVQKSVEGIDWTADVTFLSFDRPVSAETLKDMETLRNQPIDRPDWVGKPLPDLTVKPMSGAAVNLADLRGRPLLLDFWASFCPPCKTATLHAQELAERYKDAGLIVLTFTRDNVDDAELWAAHNHVTLPIVLDPEKGAFSAFDVNGIPVAILAGPDGKIVHYWIGLDDPMEMDSILKETLSGLAADRTARAGR